MTAEVHALPRPGSGGRTPLVPPNVDVRDAPDFRFSIQRLLRSDWARSCTREEHDAGIWLQAESLHQLPGGSLPDNDNLLARLADYGRDVQAFAAVKAKALEGWILCGDGRLYHPDVARNALHIWIGRLEKRRLSAYGNQSRAPERDFGLDEIEADIEEAAQALRAIDVQDPMLRDLTARMAKWPAARTRLNLIALEAERTEPTGYPTGIPNRQPAMGSPQRSVAQRSVANLDSDLPGRSPGQNLDPKKDQEIAEGEEPVLQPAAVADTYPENAFDQFWNEFPLKEAKKKARSAFDQVQAAGKVPFPELMAGVRRYVRSNTPKFREWCYPATWLNEERWTSGLPVAAVSPDPPGQGPPGKVFVAVDTPAWTAWAEHARRANRIGWPTRTCGRETGWDFPSMFPPGVDPPRHEGPAPS